MKRIVCTLVMITIFLVLLPQAFADMNDGLVTYFPFNGNANDESGNGNDGTVFGATLTADRFGRANNAYSFDGINDYIKASADNLPTAERTVSLWFFASILSGGVQLGYGGGGGPPGTSWLMDAGSLKHPFFGMSSHWDTNDIRYYWPQPPVGDWYHFVVATDENGTRMYINGEEKASNGNFVTNTIVLNTDLSIGVAVSPYGIAPYVDSNVGYHDGIIDDIRIYNRALSEAEILKLFTEPPGPCTLPVGHLNYCRDCGPCAEGDGDCDNDGECEGDLTCVQVPGTDTCQGICDIPVGHLDYCRDCGPCAEDEGDCDNNSECESGLTCDQVSGVDTCQGTCDIPVGHLDYCRNCGPCAAGEGDCDSNSECEAGLNCLQVPGVDTCQNACALPIGHLDYCQNCGPCGAGEGDCDNDSECQSGLNCVQVTGTDVCCPHPIGHLDYCRDCGPCRSGQGDCDNDSECQSGLTCPEVSGTDTCQ